MKKTIIILFVAFMASAAIAQHPAAKLRKTVTTTVDTILVDMSAAKMVTDSAVLARVDELESRIKENNEAVNSKLNWIQRNIKNSGYVGNFAINVLRHSVPLMPFVAAIFIVFFALRYSYRRKMMNQDLIIKYIDRGETVPEWLRSSNTTQSEWGMNQSNNQDENRPSLKNAKIFIILTIILGVSTFIWAIALVNSNGLYSILTAATVTLALGYATIYCFQQYLKRS